jgi:hypothetical protein
MTRRRRRTGVNLLPNRILLHFFPATGREKPTEVEISRIS